MKTAFYFLIPLKFTGFVYVSIKTENLQGEMTEEEATEKASAMLNLPEVDAVKVSKRVQKRGPKKYGPSGPISETRIKEVKIVK